MFRTGDNAVIPAQRCARNNSTITIARTQSSAGIFWCDL